MSIQCEQRLYACKFTITARYCIQLSKQRGNVKAKDGKGGSSAGLWMQLGSKRLVTVAKREEREREGGREWTET